MSNTNWSKTTIAQAVGVAVAGTATGAHADALQPSVTLTQYNLQLNSENYSGGTYGYSSKNTIENGKLNTLKITFPVNNQWDVAASLSSSNFTDAKHIKYYSGFSSRSEARADYHDIRFEAGYHTRLGNVDTRLSGGLQYVDLKQTIDLGFGYYNKYPRTSVANATHHLKGMGVHVGAEGNMPLSSGFSVSGAIGMSALDSNRTSQYEGKYTSGPSSRSDRQFIHGFDGEVALNYDLSPKTPGGLTLSLGYTYSVMYGFLETDSATSNTGPARSGPVGNGTSQLTEQGWFVRLNSTF